MKFVLLDGAKKNSGDFLIVHRAKNIIKHVFNNPDFSIIKRWKPLEDHLEEINNSDGLVLMGGPAYISNFYPDIFPLVANIEDIEVPILPMGMGWYGRQYHDISTYTFQDSTMKVFRYIQEQGINLTTRDIYSSEVLKRNGLEGSQIVMTGCPAWYDIPSFGKELDVPDEIHNILFSTPADPFLTWQSIKGMRMIKKMFPSANISAIFHRGIYHDDETSRRLSWAYRIMATAAKLLGLNVINAAYDHENLDVYRDCDLHLGYRVHGHIFSLSIKKPSFLLQEDWRGIGLTRTLNLNNDVDARIKGSIQHLERNIYKSMNIGFKDFEVPMKRMENNFDVMKNELLRLKN